MYRKRKRGRLEHIDFKLIDVLVMVIIYFSVLGSNSAFEIRPFVSGAIVLVLFSFLISMLVGIYDHVVYRKAFAEFMVSVVYIGICEFVSVLFLVFVEDKHVGIEAAWLYLVSGIGLDFIVKLIYKELLKMWLRSYSSKRKLIVVTSDDTIDETLSRLTGSSIGQVEVSGIVLINSQKYKVGDKIKGYSFVCEIEELPNYLLKQWIDEVFMNLPTQRAPYDVINKLTQMGIATHRVINFDLDKNSSRVVEQIAGFTCLTESIRVVQSTQFTAKRIVDIIGGIVGSLMTILITLIIGPIIYFTDPGPIFFSQPRIGKGGRVFKMIKFRSMYKDAEARKKELMDKNKVSDGMMFKMDNDPRILGSGPDGTKKGIGWFIRKTSLDEFPQFFLVLKGDMSLVGTRPPTLDEWEKYNYKHRARMAIRPGITGMWQVSGRSDITDFEKVVELDMEYIKKMSFLFDIKLILKTVKNIFTGDGAK